MSEIKGYKVFNPDWTCKGFQYEVGKSYEMEKEPIACKQGFHFCKKLIQCYAYYDFNKENKVAEITAYGKIDAAEDGKICTNKIKIERALSWEEVIDAVNTGERCTGGGNTGDGNSGNRNTGRVNTGNGNTGSYNSGNQNCGNFNSGDWNSGNLNQGNRNSGDWNKTNYSNGCFNTIEQPMYFFNKISNWSHWDWDSSEAKLILNRFLFSYARNIYEEEMTEEEKEAHPEYKITGFYLKELTQEEMAKKNQKKWDKLSQKEKEIVMAIPNFDKAIFKEMTGIDVDEQKGETETCS